MREFWLVDPETHTIEQLLRRGDRYAAARTESERIPLRILRGMAIDLDEVW